jgi:hypothetical protein
LEGWEKIGYSLGERLKEELVRTYPYRFSYKDIRFILNADLLAQIDTNRLAMLEIVKPQIFMAIDAFCGNDAGDRAELSN